MIVEILAFNSGCVKHHNLFRQIKLKLDINKHQTANYFDRIFNGQTGIF